MSFNFDLRTWTAPHWITVAASTVGAAVVGALVTYVEAVPASELLQDLTTPTGLEALLRGALSVGAIAGLTAIVNMAKQILAPAAQKTANALAQGQVK